MSGRVFQVSLFFYLGYSIFQSRTWLEEGDGERERKRERESVCVCVRERETERKRERERQDGRSVRQDMMQLRVGEASTWGAKNPCQFFVIFVKLFQNISQNALTTYLPAAQGYQNCRNRRRRCCCCCQCCQTTLKVSPNF